IALRSADTRNLADDVMNVLDRPAQNAVVNLMDLRVPDQPLFLQRLLPRLLEMRNATGRPHWIVIDEAHHLLPASSQAGDGILAPPGTSVGGVTVHPGHVAPAAWQAVQTAIIVGRDPQATADAFARTRGRTAISLPRDENDATDPWIVRNGSSPVKFRP